MPSVAAGIETNTVAQATPGPRPPDEPTPPRPRPDSVCSTRMEQRVSLVTLGVADYASAKAFYTALGWVPALDVEETTFFQANGVILVLWARDKLAQDMGIP